MQYADIALLVFFFFVFEQKAIQFRIFSIVILAAAFLLFFFFVRWNICYENLNYTYHGCIHLT